MLTTSVFKRSESGPAARRLHQQARWIVIVLLTTLCCGPALAATLSFLDGGEPSNKVLDRSNVRLRLDDAAQNADPAAIESVSATISSQVTGDAETIDLVETGPNTGLFEGEIQLSPSDTSGDGLLSSRTGFDSPWGDLYEDVLTAVAVGQTTTTDVESVRGTFLDPYGEPTETVAVGEAVNGSMFSPSIDHPIETETPGWNVRVFSNYSYGEAESLDLEDLPETGLYRGGNMVSETASGDPYDGTLQIVMTDTLEGSFQVGPTEATQTVDVVDTRTVFVDSTRRAVSAHRAGEALHLEVFHPNQVDSSIGIEVCGVQECAYPLLNSVGGGLFRGDLPTEATPSAVMGDGVLQVDPTGGESVTATYTDGVFPSSDTLTTVPAFGTRSALFVVGNSALGAGDQAVFDRLNAQGWTVLPIDDGASTSADADGHDLVLISSTVSSGQVHSKFRDVTVPVLVWEPYVLDDLGMTGSVANLDYGSEPGHTTLDIRDPSHPLAAGLDGAITVASTSGRITYARPASTARGIARVGNRPERLSTVAYEVGEVMAGHVAPARRVSTFLSDTTAASLTADGWALFDAAVCWASRCQGEPLAVFTASISGPTGRTVDFDASGSMAFDGASIVSYEWSFGDGGTAQSVTPRRVYPAASFSDDHGFLAVLKVTDTFGRSATARQPMWFGTPPEALFVARSELLDAADAAIFERLRLQGIRGTTIGHSSLTAADANGMDLVLISATVVSSQVGATFLDLAVPVVTWETHLFDDMAMTLPGTSNFGRDLSQPGVDVVAPWHPIIEFGFSSGLVPVDGTGNVGWGIVPGTADVIATSPADPDHAAVFAYDEGQILADGQPAPHRRVGLWLGDDAGSSLTSDGLRLLHGVLNWTTWP